MKHAMMAAAIVLAIGAGGFLAVRVQGADGAKAAPAPLKPVTPEPGSITPPPPPPDVPIPPIPEVDKNNPFHAGPAPVRKPKADVLEEGKRLFDREGRLEMDSLGRPLFVFDSGDKPMRLLENSWREHLESVTQRGTKRVRWRVSGLITVYQGANYLLLSKAERTLAEDENL
jgi:hypothetical protein